MGYSKHELGPINMLHFLKKIVILHPYLLTKATFFCPQGGRCGKIRLYTRFQPDIEVLTPYLCSYVIPTTVEALLATTLVSDQV